MEAVKISILATARIYEATVRKGIWAAARKRSDPRSERPESACPGS